MRRIQIIKHGLFYLILNKPIFIQCVCIGSSSVQHQSIFFFPSNVSLFIILLFPKKYFWTTGNQIIITDDENKYPKKPKQKHGPSHYLSLRVCACYYTLSSHKQQHIQFMQIRKKSSNILNIKVFQIYE